MTQKEGFCVLGKKQSQSIARYRSKVRRQIILHLENTDVIILYFPHGADASVRTQCALAGGGKKKKTTDDT